MYIGVWKGGISIDADSGFWTFDAAVVFVTNFSLSFWFALAIRGCQIGMQGPQSF